jgi:hypothetical protein
MICLWTELGRIYLYNNNNARDDRQTSMTIEHTLFVVGSQPMEEGIGIWGLSAVYQQEEMDDNKCMVYSGGQVGKEEQYKSQM